MTEESKQIEVIETPSETLSPAKIVENELAQVSADVAAAKTEEELKQAVNMFNVNNVKTNILRINKINEMLSKTYDRIEDRLDKHGDEFTNKDYLDVATALSNQLEKSQKVIDKVDEKPLIQINTVKNEVNINTQDQESKERVINAVKYILANAGKLQETPVEQEEVIDAEVTDVIVDEATGDDNND